MDRHSWKEGAAGVSSRRKTPRKRPITSCSTHAAGLAAEVLPDGHRNSAAVLSRAHLQDSGRVWSASSGRMDAQHLAQAEGRAQLDILDRGGISL
jgi:hypothetical protein